MRDWWPFVAVCGIAVALLSFWAGAVTVTGVNPEIAPHGIIEYWTDRYQTVLASLVALFGAAVVVLQIRETRSQHQANVRLAMRNEIEAVASAESFAESVIASALDSRHDVGAALLNFNPSRYFVDVEPDRLARIEQWAGDAVSYFVRRLIADIATYREWQTTGSPVTTDIFGDTTPTFEQRIAWIVELARNTNEVCRLRRVQLQSYWN